MNNSHPTYMEVHTHTGQKNSYWKLNQSTYETNSGSAAGVKNKESAIQAHKPETHI